VPHEIPSRDPCLEGIDIFVIAGGLGTRIAPVLGDVPKLLAPISGRPYLDYLVEWLCRFGARRIVLGLGHHATAVTDYLDRTAMSLRDCAVEVIVEPRPLGTAGAIRFAGRRLQTDPVLIMNGDSFVDANLCQFLDHHRRAGADATLLCTEVEDAGRFGRVVLDRTGRIEGFMEKDSSFHESSPISAGVYLFSKKFLEMIAGSAGASLERDIFAQASAGSLAAYAGRFKFVDIGTPESLAFAGRVIGKAAESESP
jgi:NDP-sugar pyrophosphorylase family protein